MSEDIKVSVFCTAYNHEPYLRSALEGFVNQKTSFKYEVLIHDDASTDKTADIIREYEHRYPDIIKPVYQTENQWSKGVTIIMKYLLPHAKGKYIAICEGDDYWNCDTKLQEQYNYLESHPGCSLVVHKTNNYFEKEEYFAPYLKEAKFVLSDGTVPVENIISKHDAIFHTTSLFFRKSYYTDNADFLKTVVSYDYIYKILLACTGYVYMIPKVMSVHRIGTIGSYHDRWDKDSSVLLQLYAVECDNLAKINAYTGRAYNNFFVERISMCVFYSAILTCDTVVLAKEPYRTMFIQLPISTKCSFYVRLYCPFAYKVIRNVKRKLVGAWQRYFR